MAEIWTQADIDKLKTAVASGVLTVYYEGPPKRQITYQSLEAMRSLLAEMIGQVTGAPRSRLAAFSKGFDSPNSNGSGGNGSGTFGGG